MQLAHMDRWGEQKRAITGDVCSKQVSKEDGGKKKGSFGMRPEGSEKRAWKKGPKPSISRSFPYCTTKKCQKQAKTLSSGTSHTQRQKHCNFCLRHRIPASFAVPKQSTEVSLEFNIDPNFPPILLL